MAQQIAKLNYLRMAPRKTRLVADTVKKLPVNEAEALLLASPRKSAEPILKLLRSAIANAKNNKQMEVSRLFVKEIRVDKGQMLKRLMPRARGQGAAIQKKGSHVTLILEESDKLKTSRFNIIKPERIKKSEFRKMKEHKEAEKEKSKEALRAEIKSSKGPGFMKRMFRRKSI